MSSRFSGIRIAALTIATTLAASAVAEERPMPVPGGTLEVGTIFSTLSALSFDPKDWPWKLNHDTGAAYEQLLVADLSKSRQYGGPYAFKADAWLPSDAIRGELA